MSKKFIHIGRHLNRDEFKPDLKTEFTLNKPNKCIWGCKYKPSLENPISDWYTFCINEELRDMSNDVKVTIFKLRDDASIYKINTKSDLLNFPLVKSKKGLSKYVPILDFIEMSKDYNVIQLTKKGFLNIHSEFEFGAPTIYGWDMPCIAILNFDAIDEDSIKHLTIGDLLNK